MQSFKLFVRIIILGFILFSLSITSAHSAMVEYSYQGNLFGTTYDSDPPSGVFTVNDSITGSFVVSDYLGGNLNLQLIAYDAFSFSAGSYTIASTDTDLYIDFIRISTDAAGVITDWRIDLEAGVDFWVDPTAVTGDQYRLIYLGGPGPAQATGDRIFVDQCTDGDAVGGCTADGNHGTDAGYIRLGTWQSSMWTAQQVGAVPVPAAIYLFGTALIGLVGFSKRRKAAEI